MLTLSGRAVFRSRRYGLSVPPCWKLPAVRETGNLLRRVLRVNRQPLNTGLKVMTEALRYQHRGVTEIIVSHRLYG